jgi:hypothetical protein
LTFESKNEIIVDVEWIAALSEEACYASRHFSAFIIPYIIIGELRSAHSQPLKGGQL